MMRCRSANELSCDDAHRDEQHHDRHGEKSDKRPPCVMLFAFGNSLARLSRYGCDDCPCRRSFGDKPCARIVPITKQPSARLTHFSHITEIDNQSESVGSGRRGLPNLLKFTSSAVRYSSCNFETECRRSIMHVVFEIIICSCSWHAPYRGSWAAIGRSSYLVKIKA